jgi:hypothetical protein
MVRIKCLFLVFIETLTYNIQQELACSKTFPSTGPFCLRLTGLILEIRKFDH